MCSRILTVAVLYPRKFYGKRASAKYSEQKNGELVRAFITEMFKFIKISPPNAETIFATNLMLAYELSFQIFTFYLQVIFTLQQKTDLWKMWETSKRRTT